MSVMTSRGDPRAYFLSSTAHWRHLATLALHITGRATPPIDNIPSPTLCKVCKPSYGYNYHSLSINHVMGLRSF